VHARAALDDVEKCKSNSTPSVFPPVYRLSCHPDANIGRHEAFAICKSVRGHSWIARVHLLTRERFVSPRSQCQLRRRRVHYKQTKKRTNERTKVTRFH
jgi:hypothetical protein